MSEVELAKKQLEKAREALRVAEARERLKKREEDLTKYPSEFPPGFSFDWYHRHDPFESYWQLTLSDRNGNRISSWEIEGSDSEVKIKAREQAWELVDWATKVCKAVGLLEV